MEPIQIFSHTPRRLRAIILLAAMALAGTAMPNADKLSVSLSRVLLQRAARSASEPELQADTASSLFRAARSESPVPVMIHCDNDLDKAELSALGFASDFETASLIYGRILLSSLSSLSNMRGVRKISAPGRQYPTMDCAREFSGIDKAQDGVPSPESGDLIPFTGKGVVIGIVDAGIDPTHITFLPQAEGDTYRVKEYVRTVGSLESEEGFYADIYDTEEAILSAPIDEGARGHGTHTSGIAAGAFRGNKYYGVAPDADLLMISMGDELYDDEIAYGIEHVLDYGAEVGKPVAVNLSLGSTFGLHTGENFVTELLRGRDMTGQAVVFAAGNDGRNQCSLLHRFNGADPNESIATFLLYTYGAIPLDGDILASSAHGKTFDIAISVVSVSADDAREVYRTDFVSAEELLALGDDEFLPLLSSRFASRFPELADYFTAELYLYPGREESAYYNQILYRRTVDDRNTNPYTIGLVIRSREGAEVLLTVPGNIYLMASRGIPGYLSGSGEQSISDSCTSPYVISAGAWNARDSYTTLDGTHYSAPEAERSAIAYYSSYGTQLLTDEQLPQVCAPGTNVCASVLRSKRPDQDMALFSKDGRDYYWALNSGTSMAAPVVTGTIALWLQAKPDLTYEQILSLIESTSRYDEKCSERPLAAGAGKIDAYEGLKKILTEMLSAPLNPADLPSQLMIRRKGVRNLECVVPAAGASGVAEIYSLQGELLERIPFTGSLFTADMKESPAGVYLLRAITDKGIFTQKLTIQ